MSRAEKSSSDVPVVANGSRDQTASKSSSFLETSSKPESDVEALADQPVNEPSGDAVAVMASPLSPTMQIVPRSERRGIAARFTLIPEVRDPRTYSNGKKWLMTTIVALAAATSSTGTSIFYPALGQVAVALHTTTTITNMSLAFYMLAMAFTPMWWSYFSERLGRRNVYLLSFVLFLIFSVISAVSVNIAMLIIFRTLSGGASAAVQVVGAGTVADIWEPKYRGKAMGVFFLGPLCGPGIAPVIGGILAEKLGWRSTLWGLTIFTAVLLLCLIFLLPETLARRATPDAAAQKQQSTTMYIVRGFIDPMKALAILRHPPVLISVYIASFSFAVLYVVNIAIQANFEASPYQFSEIEVGLLYLAPTIGYLISSQINGRWIDYIMAREARKAGRYDADGKPIYLPEDRMMENIWIAAFIYPAAIIWYGWTADKGIIWIVPILATVFFGIGCMLVIGCITTMLTEFTPNKSSSGVAVNNFVRNILSCITAVVTQPMLAGMTTRWAFTMVGLFAWVTTCLAIAALKKWGTQWRIQMDQMRKQNN